MFDNQLIQVLAFIKWMPFLHNFFFPLSKVKPNFGSTYDKKIKFVRKCIVNNMYRFIRLCIGNDMSIIAQFTISFIYLFKRIVYHSFIGAIWFINAMFVLTVSELISTIMERLNSHVPTNRFVWLNYAKDCVWHVISLKFPRNLFTIIILMKWQ